VKKMAGRAGAKCGGTLVRLEPSSTMLVQHRD